ncbi:hypothetical protein BJX64DRAFT_282808 [Aspergillus heterothallicus]
MTTREDNTNPSPHASHVPEHEKLESTITPQLNRNHRGSNPAPTAKRHEHQAKKMLLTLPPELHLLLLTHLTFPEKSHLKLTCHYFHTLIAPMTHDELLTAENTQFATERDLYACRYCLRLRHRDKFADRMLRRARGRRGRDARKRFCVQCGLKPREGGEARYGAGARVVLRGQVYVLCMECGGFGVAGVLPGGVVAEVCSGCFAGVYGEDGKKRS